MHSTAQARGMAAACDPPQASAAASTSAGRMRLPPAKSEYRMALWIVAGLAVALGRNRSRALSTSRVCVVIQEARSKWDIGPDLVTRRRPGFQGGIGPTHDPTRHLELTSSRFDAP